MSNEIESVKKWAEETGLKTGEAPSIDVEYISTLHGETVKTLDMEELEAIISSISSYSIFLKNLKGTLLAQINQLEGKYRRALALGMMRQTKFKYRDEKEAAALEVDRDLAAMERQLTVLRMKYSKIKDMPESLDKHIDVLRMSYYRRKDELKGSS